MTGLQPRSVRLRDAIFENFPGANSVLPRSTYVMPETVICRDSSLTNNNRKQAKERQLYIAAARRFVQILKMFNWPKIPNGY